MKKLLSSVYLDILHAVKSKAFKPFLAIIYVTIVITIYFYYGISDFFVKTYPSIDNVDYWKVIYHNMVPLFLFGILGLLFIKFVLRSKLTDYGLGLGDKKTGLMILAIVGPIMIISGIIAATDKEMSAMYPLARGIISDLPVQFALLYFFSYLCYYIGWEILFRGITQFSIQHKYDALIAIAISTMISALIHSSIAGFGKPSMETTSAIVAGIIFGYTAYKTKSIWYSFALHLIVGFTTDIAIILFTRSGII